jgi:signal peptidase II
VADGARTDHGERSGCAEAKKEEGSEDISKNENKHLQGGFANEEETRRALMIPGSMDKNSMRPIFTYAILVLVLLALIGCDQITKDLARQGLADASPRMILGGLVRLTYAENPGTFMGLGAELNEGLRFAVYSASAIVVLVCIVLLFAYADRVNRLISFGSAVLLAGAIGNLVDRFVNDGRVIDFMVVGAGPLHTGVFNVADVLIAVGLVLFLFGFRGRQGNRPRTPGATDTTDGNVHSA